MTAHRTSGHCWRAGRAVGRPGHPFAVESGRTCTTYVASPPKTEWPLTCGNLNAARNAEIVHPENIRYPTRTLDTLGISPP